MDIWYYIWEFYYRDWTTNLGVERTDSDLNYKHCERVYRASSS